MSRPFADQNFHRKVRGAFALWALGTCPLLADDAAIGTILKARGAEVTDSKGVITAVTIPDRAKLGDEDFGQIPRLGRLKSLSVSNGLTDARLAQLAGLPELEYLQTNLAAVTDEGIKPLAQLKALKNLKFFHPGKAFSGAGLLHLADLPNLQSVTVAGSLAFNDEGMAAVGKLSRLREFRTWHAGPTDEGVKKLQQLKHLKNLHLGQRLSYKGPACPSDPTIALLVGIPSLESLVLDEARLSSTALQQLKGLPSLKKLTLSGIDISKGELERLRTDLSSMKIEWTEPNEVYQKRIRSLFGGK